jgi:diguanylate cyclase (GGDEF)-like protein/PAS domain S-box-containing protein
MAHLSAALFQTFIKPYSLAQQNEAMARLKILKGLPEGTLDQVAQIVRFITGASIASVNVVDPESVKVICQTGQLEDSYAHEQSFCGFAVLDPDIVTVVEDASKDMRFARHAIVTGNEHIRFYAGSHVLTPTGMPVATICAYDTVTRTLTEEQKKSLAFLSRMLSQRLELINHNERLAAEKRKFNAFMNSGPMVAFIKDHEGRYSYVNQQFIESFGISEQGILGKRDKDLWPEVGEQLASHDRWIMSQSEPVEVTEEGPADANGQPTWWQSYKFVIPGVPPSLGGVALDVTALHAVQEKIKNPSGTDLLTGLPNKQTLLRELPRVFSRKHEANEPFAVLHVDIDRFKPFTETYGDGAGDAMVRRLADSISKSIRVTDRPYHLRCDEFIILIENLGTEEEASGRCKEILKKASQTLLLPAQRSDVAISIGVAIFNGEDADYQSLLLRADKARKNAKRQGSGYST